MKQQESTPVGCIPTAEVASSRGGGMVYPLDTLSPRYYNPPHTLPLLDILSPEYPIPTKDMGPVVIMDTG